MKSINMLRRFTGGLKNVSMGHVPDANHMLGRTVLGRAEEIRFLTPKFTILYL